MSDIVKKLLKILKPGLTIINKSAFTGLVANLLSQFFNSNSKNLISKNNLIIIISTVLIVVLSIGGYFIYSNSQSSPKNTNKNITISSTDR